MLTSAEILIFRTVVRAILGNGTYVSRMQDRPSLYVACELGNRYWFPERVVAQLIRADDMHGLALLLRSPDFLLTTCEESNCMGYVYRGECADARHHAKKGI